MRYIVVRMVEGGQFRIDVYRDRRSITRALRPVGYEFSTRLRPELRGQPKLPGLRGPMWGGTYDGEPVIRYEDRRAYSVLSQ